MSERQTFEAETGVLEGAVHRYPLRVMFADTDAAGVVYHARYLEFAERARMEMLRCAGLADIAVGRAGTVIVVRRCTIDFQAPGRLDDLILCTSRVTDWGGASFELEQKFTCQDRDLVTILLRLVCIDAEFRALRVPAAVRQAFGADAV